MLIALCFLGSVAVSEEFLFSKWSPAPRNCSQNKPIVYEWVVRILCVWHTEALTIIRNPPILTI